MARGRFISESIATDARLNSLSVEAELVYLMVVPHLDRDGLIEGDPDVLWGKVCPKRRQFLDGMAIFIQEWAKAGLVSMYDTDEGPVLWFKGFTKNQQGMRYEREAPSKFPAPPDSTTPDKLPTNSGNCPPHVRAGARPEVQVKDQVKDQGRAEGAPAPATATLDPNVAQVWKAWDANMPGMRTPVITDSVNSLLDEYSAAEIVEAIGIACRKNKRYLDYVKGILSKGAFSEKPPPSGGDYRPTPTRNGGVNAILDYAEMKGYTNGRH